MKKTLLLGPSILCVLLLAAPALNAQAPGTGFPAFGSFTSGSFDAVNNQNLNVIFNMPVMHSPGRGTDLGL